MCLYDLQPISPNVFNFPTLWIIKLPSLRQTHRKASRSTKGEVVTLIILLTQYFDKFSGFALK